MFCNFKNLLNKIKKVIIFNKILITKFTFFQFKLQISRKATVFIGFTFFLIFIPFWVKGVSAFSFQSGFNVEESNILVRENLVEKLCMFDSGLRGEFSVLKYLDKWQEGCFESLESFFFFMLSGDDTCEQSTNQDRQEDEAQFFYYIYICYLYGFRMVNILYNSFSYNVYLTGNLFNGWFLAIE